MTEYQIQEIETAERNHDKEFFIKVKFSGTNRESKWFDLTPEQVIKIKGVLKNE